MRQRLTPLALGLCLMGVLSVPAYADNTSSNVSTQTLEKQVNQLQKELVSLKRELHAKQVGGKANTVRAQSVAASINAQNAATEATAPQISGPNSLPGINSTRYIPIDLDVPGQSFVSSGPYLGVPLEFAGSNLIINDPSVNEDVSLMHMRKNINDRLKVLGIDPEEMHHSHLLLSGIVEGQGIYRYMGATPSQSDIDVTNATIDAYILGPSSWTSALLELTYDNSVGTQEGSLFYNTRTANSRVLVNKAFITIGDLSKSPIYGTIGQMFVPFGVYSTSMVSNPLTKLMARTQERAVELGYHPAGENAPYASLYAFKGDSHGSSLSRINNGGVNLGYRLSQASGKYTEDLGGGVLGNIADSQGMQITGDQAPQFGGFGANSVCTVVPSANNPTGIGTCGNEKIVHRVPAYDLHGKIGIGDAWDLLGEYITASTQFNPTDLTMNSHGAKPEALHTEIAYTFQSFKYPTSLAGGYDMTKDALAIGLPAKRMSLVVNTSFWRNTLESLEFRHDTNYSRTSYATGSNVTGPGAIIVGGPSDNVVTAQMDIYF